MKGNDEASEELLLDLLSKIDVRKLSTGKSRNGVERADIFQEALLRFWTVCAKKNTKIENPAGYFFVTYKNVEFEMLRKTKPDRFDTIDDVLKPNLAFETSSCTESPEAAICSRIDNEQFEKALVRCFKTFKDKDERYLLKLIFLDGLSNEEIALRTGCDIKIVRHDVNKLKAKLRGRVRSILHLRNTPAEVDLKFLLTYKLSSGNHKHKPATGNLSRPKAA